MGDLVKYLQAGKLILRDSHPLVVYQVTKFSEVENIISFLNKYPLQGVKRFEFED